MEWQMSRSVCYTGNMQHKAIPRRIYIVGAAGSGKTTLAKRLAPILHATAYEMDVLSYEGGFGAQYPLEVRLAEMVHIAAQASWVVEGGSGYLGEASVLLNAADVIVWLDLPWSITRWRIITRHIKADLARNNRHSGYRKLYYFLQDARVYYLENKNADTSEQSESAYNIGFTRASTQHFLQHYVEKLVHCQRPADVAAFFQSIARAAHE